ncbi:hypothetical protein GCM10027517_08710 [Phycicoccus ginsengisoli]
MPETSSAPRVQQGEPETDGLTYLSLRELLQRLAACEEALRTPAGASGVDPLSVVGGPAARRARSQGDGSRWRDPADPADPADTGGDGKVDALRAQAAISRELERRRHLRHPRQNGVERRRSAAWPPPPW